MANIIRPKRSNTASNVPTTANLSSGEIAVNMADQKIYINNGTSIVQVGAGKITALQDVTITSPTSSQVLSWNGTAWVNATPASGSIVTKMIYDNFTSTAAQTSFTTSATYTSGKIEVYCNGVKMVNGTDVTVTSGTAVVFAVALAVGNLVTLVYPI